jgi:hypothetical protein
VERIKGQIEERVVLLDLLRWGVWPTWLFERTKRVPRSERAIQARSFATRCHRSFSIRLIPRLNLFGDDQPLNLVMDEHRGPARDSACALSARDPDDSAALVALLNLFGDDQPLNLVMDEHRGPARDSACALSARDPDDSAA